MRDNPSRNASRQEISQVSHNTTRREVLREFLREISLHDLAVPVFKAPSPICAYLHTYIITLKYVKTYLPTCKVPYTVSTFLVRQGLQDDTTELQEKAGTRLGSETDL